MMDVIVPSALAVVTYLNSAIIASSFFAMNAGLTLVIVGNLQSAASACFDYVRIVSIRGSLVAKIAM